MDNQIVQTAIDAVKKLLNDASLDDLVKSVIERLASFGYAYTTDDVWLIAFSIQKTVNHVLNQTNQSVIPKGLMEVVTDMVCGEVLNAKYLSGKLNLDSLDLSEVVQTVSEGDTSVTFGSAGSDQDKVKGLLSWLMGGKGCDFLCYRRIRW